MEKPLKVAASWFWKYRLSSAETAYNEYPDDTQSQRPYPCLLSSSPTALCQTCPRAQELPARRIAIFPLSDVCAATRAV